MRKTLFAVCLLLAVPVVAQQTPSSTPFRVTVFASDLSYTESDVSGSNFDGGIGAALEYRWTKQWSLELSITAEERSRGFSTIGTDGGLIFDRADVRSYPIDLVALHHFDPDSNWKPYLGAGARYTHTSGWPGANPNASLSPEIVGGVHYFFTPRLSLRFDAKQLLRGDTPEGDKMFKGAIGLGWRF